jgi:adenosylmethionine-8-amino-7-oxononanoate aminotransferase
MLPQWDEIEVMRVSQNRLVARAVVIGTILAIELAESSISGLPAYATQGLAVEIARVLRGAYNIYCRPLGPVLYLMVLPSTNRKQCKTLLESLHAVLDEMSRSNLDFDAMHKDGVIV